jgi:ABC-type glycerol-3-phosphate transport system substrate-binding protein
MIRNNAGVRVEIRAVPDAQLIDRLTSDEAAGDPPDFVVGDDALARQLTQLGFTNTQLIRI